MTRRTNQSGGQRQTGWRRILVAGVLAIDVHGAAAAALTASDPTVKQPPAARAERIKESEGAVTMTTKSTIEGYFHGLEQRNGWDAYLADELVFTSYTTPNRQVAGKQAYLTATKGFYGSIRSFALRDLVVDGDTACALTHYELQRPGGEPFASDVAEIFKVKDGHITSFAIYFDSAPFPK
jgi:ketosteroid isomerase-like protein